MKPFYTKQMLVEMSSQEVSLLSNAVHNEMDRWADMNEDGSYVFPEKHEIYRRLYNDLIYILEQMPWEM